MTFKRLTKLHDITLQLTSICIRKFQMYFHNWNQATPTCGTKEVIIQRLFIRQVDHCVVVFVSTLLPSCLAVIVVIFRLWRCYRYSLEMVRKLPIYVGTRKEAIWGETVEAKPVHGKASLKLKLKQTKKRNKHSLSFQWISLCFWVITGSEQLTRLNEPIVIIDIYALAVFLGGGGRKWGGKFY